MKKIFLITGVISVFSAVPAFAMQCNYLGVCSNKAGYVESRALERMPDGMAGVVSLSACCMCATGLYVCMQTDCCGRLGQALGLADQIPANGVTMNGKKTVCVATTHEESKKGH